MFFILLSPLQDKADTIIWRASESFIQLWMTISFGRLYRL